MKHRHRQLSFIPLGLLFASLLPASAQIVWKGADGSGGSGTWNTASEWATNALPTSANEVRFEVSPTYPTVSSTVNVGTGVSANSAAFRVRYGKNLTVNMADSSSLTGTLLYVGDGGSGTTSSHALFQGPASGAATVNFTRVWLTSSTGARNTLTFGGSNLTVNLTGAYSDIASNNTVTISGATVRGGEFYVRTGDNRLTLSSGSLSGTLIDNSGLIQVASGASLAGSSGNMNLYVRSGGRLEIEGSGIASTVATRVFGGGTVAVGVSSIDSGTGTFSRTAPSVLSLSSRIQLENLSKLEIGIFGHNANDLNFGVDQINFATGGSLALNASGSLISLVLTTHDYTLQAGDSWRLFTGNVTVSGTGLFDLQSLTNQGWDVSQFNAGGGWILTYAVPEPGTLLLVAAAGGLLIMARRRR